ncbi:hypothetical protein F4804DRAFT_113149 [Jackrogersella minutella]|nr:hypothetical protein F4804DRAFT_113149 [Jackrogersella minutella]
MLENFTFAQKAASDTTSDDDDPPQSPKSKSSEQSSPTMSTIATPTNALYTADGDRIDCLVRKLSKQTFVRDPRSALSSEAQNYETYLNLATSQIPIPIPIPIEAPSDVAGPSVEPGPSHSILPVIDNNPTHVQQQQYYEIIEHRPEHVIACEDSHLRVPDNDRPWRHSETRFNSNTSKSRSHDLMSNMVENGVQCNVRASRSISPMPAPRKPSSSDLTPSIGPIYNINPQIMHNGDMEVEVDPDFCKNDDNDDEDPSSGPSVFRDASVPSRVRKFGYLKYRSSSEAAARCKNMRKSLPRMRKRPKVTRTDSTASPSTINSTTH